MEEVKGGEEKRIENGLSSIVLIKGIVESNGKSTGETFINCPMEKVYERRGRGKDPTAYHLPPTLPGGYEVQQAYFPTQNRKPTFYPYKDLHYR